ESTTLSTVVVTGLGRTTQTAAIGYSVGSVDGEKLSVAKNTDVSTALAGKIAGVQLIGSPSSTFGNADIIIRGVKGLGLSSPLFVVDGTPTAQENVIMDNVENISVLKGAAATAVWGNRGQNGVVLITSKKGARGSKPAIDVNLGGNIENLALLPGYQDVYAGGYSSNNDTPAQAGTDAAGQYKFAYNAAIHPASWQAFNGQTIIDYGADESWGPKMAGQQYRPYYSWYPGANFGVQSPMTPQPDAINSFFQNGRTFNNSIAFTGGTEGFNFRLTYANQNRTLILPGSQRDNNQLGISANYDISQKFTVSTDFNYRRVKTDRLPQEAYRNDGLNVTQNFNQWWQRQIEMERLKDYRNADGTLNSWNIGDPNSGGAFLKPQYWDSPYFVVEENYGMSRGNNVFGNLGLNYKITDWLNFDNRVRLNYSESSGDFRIATGGLQQDSFSISSSNNTEFNFESNLNARKSFGDFSVDAGLGVNLRTNRSRSTLMATQGGLTFPNFFSIAGSVARPTTTNGYSAREVRSILGRASMGYKGIIYVDATIRNDWSSALPTSDNSYMYPSISTSFVFTELMKDAAFTKYLTFGKLRASYAQVGSDLGFNSVNTQIGSGSIFNSYSSSSISDIYRSGQIKPA
ncbi:MAG: SusC/RagA family TonB-linked outer membrane protein, partial [Chitinophagaceae bacterium]